MPVPAQRTLRPQRRRAKVTMALLLSVAAHLPNSRSDSWASALASLSLPCFGLSGASLADCRHEEEAAAAHVEAIASRGHVANAILRKGWAGVEGALGLEFPEQRAARQDLSSRAMAASGTDEAIQEALDMLRMQDVAPCWLRDTCLGGQEAQRGHWERFYRHVCGPSLSPILCTREGPLSNHAMQPLTLVRTTCSVECAHSRRTATSFFRDRNLLRSLFPALMPPEGEGSAFNASKPCAPLAGRFTPACGLYQAALARIRERSARSDLSPPCKYCNATCPGGQGPGKRADSSTAVIQRESSSAAAALSAMARSCHRHDMSLPEYFVALSEAANVGGRLERGQILGARAPCGARFNVSGDALEKVWRAALRQAGRDAGRNGRKGEPGALDPALSLLDFISLFIKHGEVWRGKGEGEMRQLLGFGLCLAAPSPRDLAHRHLVVVEMGCGVGNSMWPVLRANSQRDVFVIGLDVSYSAIALVTSCHAPHRPCPRTCHAPCMHGQRRHASTRFRVSRSGMHPFRLKWPHCRPRCSCNRIAAQRQQHKGGAVDAIGQR